MRDFIKKYWCQLILAIIVFVFLIPALINGVFMLGYYLDIPRNVAWGANDTLLFYGSMMGALATIVAVVSTILYTKNSQEAERELYAQRQEQERQFSLELMKKQLKFDRQNKNFDHVLEHLQDVALYLDPIRFIEIGTYMNLENYHDKMVDLQNLGMNCNNKIGSITLFIHDEYFDDELRSYIKFLHNFKGMLSNFVTNVSVICQGYSNYALQQSENEKYRIMVELNKTKPIDPEELEMQRLKTKDIGSKELNVITDLLMPEYKKLIDLRSNEYQVIISHTKAIIEHLRTKYDEKLN